MYAEFPRGVKRAFLFIQFCMKLSVTLIARNEEEHLARLLPQLRFADEVVVVDTGSSDGTCREARRHSAKVLSYEWRDDFAAARNFALQNASGDFVMWLDADDVLPEKTQKKLMGLKNSLAQADFYYMRYRMDADFPFWFWRERIVRRCSKCRFAGFIHEAIAPFGKAVYLDCEVLHRPSGSHAERNLRIYRNAIARGKRLGLRDKYYFARTLLDNSLSREAAPLLKYVARSSHASPPYCYDCLKLLARLALADNLPKEALRYLSRAVRLLPPDGETCCLFGQVYFDAQLWRQAAEWYGFAKNSSSESGFVNSYYTDFLPNVQLSVCCWNMGLTAQAKSYHLAAKAVAPLHPAVTRNDVFFR